MLVPHFLINFEEMNEKGPAGLPLFVFKTNNFFYFFFKKCKTDEPGELFRGLKLIKKKKERNVMDEIE